MALPQRRFVRKILVLLTCFVMLGAFRIGEKEAYLVLAQQIEKRSNSQACGLWDVYKMTIENVQ